ncbi:MAG: hypothetical protein QNJ97_22480 [Myxococcota bacterium]|nr:hypothetical protein [Myxococcota bacterium]
MKHLIFILFMALGSLCCACDDDEDKKPDEEDGGCEDVCDDTDW